MTATTAPATVDATATARPPLRRLLAAGAVGGALAAVLSIAVLLLGNAVIDGVVQVTPPGSSDLQDLGVAPVLGSTILPGIIGGLVLWLLLRVSPGRGRTAFLVLAVLMTFASFGSPLALDVPDAAKAVLVVMHVVTAAAIVGVLLRASRRA